MSERPDIEIPIEYQGFPQMEAAFDAGVEACVPYLATLEAQAREGQEAIDRICNAPRAISAEADFDAMTWTFQIRPDCRTGGGTYALVWVPNVI